jgi:hypothetical protein
MLGSLTFRARHGGEQPAVIEGGVCLRGEVEWIVQGSGADLARLIEGLGPVAHVVAPGVVSVRFRNAVGRFAIAGLGTVDVRCGKWSDETFDAMLVELTAIAMDLPFAADQRAALPHDRSLAERRQILLHVFLYLRSIVLREARGTSLPFAYAAILREPHQRFVDDRAGVPFERAARADGRTFARLVAGADRLVRVAGPAAHSSLATALRGHLPTTIDAPRTERSHDTAENRFVKSVLREAAAIVDRVEEAARGRAGLWRKIADDCAAMRRVLLPLERHPLWAEVGPMVHVPMGSSVLQRRQGYKAILGHHFALRAAARLPLDAARIERLLGLKDVATLYELWTFFKVVEAVTSLLGPPDHADRMDETLVQRSVPWAFRVSWSGAQVSVFYNLSFSRGRDAPYRSSSVALRPDVVIQCGEGEGAVLHVLDAKLRVEVDRAEDEDEEDERSSKRDDLKKMHTYRDALPNVRSAYVLYPGDVFVAYPAIGEEGGGVGAIPVVPGRGAGELGEHVGRVLGR